MPNNETILFDFLLTQKSVTHKLPYDVIEDVIQNCVEYVKVNNINARVANLALNIDNKLVLAQVYVERLNGFAPTKETRFGTTPTSYKIQVRFPYGLEANLNQQQVYIPSSRLNNPLLPYKTKGKVIDDVQRDYKPRDIILGPGVERVLSDNEVSLTCVTNGQKGQQIKLNYTNDIGLGYATITHDTFEYGELSDYNMRLKVAGLAPLFYFNPVDRTAENLIQTHDYQGYTAQQWDTFESYNQAPQRKLQYSNQVEHFNQQILATDAGQYWQTCIGRNTEENAYLFNIDMINGMILYADSGLPLTRLRDYQLNLFNKCSIFINDVYRENQSQTPQRLAGKIDMGVGAGKTFFTFTLLQNLKHQMQQDKDNVYMAPAYCVAPDEAVANVTQKAINRQGFNTGTSAAAITKKAQLPTNSFIHQYQILSEQAAKEAKIIDEFINDELQTEILNFCNKHSLHPNNIINFLYNKYRGGELTTRLKTYKDSVDFKRLMLLVDAQKTIKNKTGMLGITALDNLLKQFEELHEGIKRDPFFGEVSSMVDISYQVSLITPEVNYNQPIAVPSSMVGGFGKTQINLATLTSIDFDRLLKSKQGDNIDLRDNLLIIAGLADKDAAILLANSGGLGNTSTPAQVEQQIEKLMPIAYRQLTNLIKKDNLTPDEHYQLYLYLNTLFSTIPEAVNIKIQLRRQGKSIEQFENQLYKNSLSNSLALINQIKQRINSTLKKVASVRNIEGISLEELEPFGILPTTNCIEAANQLAGIASLRITGHALEDNANLLLTHVPIFTPEGFAAYVEHLASLEGESNYSFTKEHGIYKALENGRVSREAIKARLTQFLSAIMIADEIHKQEFEFLYDETSTIYQRINQVTQMYLNKEFKDILPHRIGMSGTINDVAEKAFGKQTLYRLSTSKMIEQGLTKQIEVATATIDYQAYARQLVIDYFVSSLTLSIPNVLNNKNCILDLFTLSKGIIFSKTSDETLNAEISRLFNLLIQTNVQEEDENLQEELLAEINTKRQERVEFLEQKLQGNHDLTSAEIEQVNLFNQSHSDKLTIHNQRIINLPAKSFPITPLSSDALHAIQIQALQNNLFAIYMEYILSKSSAPKEFSDIIGLQNKLFAEGIHLTDIATNENNDEVNAVVTLMNTIDVKSITQKEIERFISERIKDVSIASQLACNILFYKNNYQVFVQQLIIDTQLLELPSLVTNNREEFEAGNALIMLGSENERTGYSHEPVGIIIDAPSDLSSYEIIDNYLSAVGSIDLNTQGATLSDDTSSFLLALQKVIETTASYNEKNQMGGRALRTPYGHVGYREYGTHLNTYLKQAPPSSALQALKIETQFEDIFTANELRAQEERYSVSFNREVISLLTHEYATIQDFYTAVCKHFLKELNEDSAQEKFLNFINQRLAFLWTIKYQPEIACTYLQKLDESSFDSFKLNLDDVQVIIAQLTTRVPVDAVLTEPVNLPQTISLDQEPAEPRLANLGSPQIVSTQSTAPIVNNTRPLSTNQNSLFTVMEIERIEMYIKRLEEELTKSVFNKARKSEKIKGLKRLLENPNNETTRESLINSVESDCPELRKGLFSGKGFFKSRTDNLLDDLLANSHNHKSKNTISRT